MSYPLIVPAAGGAHAGPGVGIPQRRYRQLLAEQLGVWAETTVSEQATAADPSRVVLADELRDDEAGYGLGVSWVYVRSGEQTGTQRRILGQDGVGYQGSRGALVLSRPYPAPLAAATLVELTAPLPSKRIVGLKGLNECIDEALDRIWIEARVVVTGNGTREHDLTALAQLWDEGQVLGIYDARGGGSADPLTRSAQSFRMVADGPYRTLVTGVPYGTADTFELAVLVRASHLTHDGAAWGYDTAHPGLQSDEQQAAAPERWVTTFGMVKALQELSKLALTIRGTSRAESREPELRTALREDAARRLPVWAAAARRIQAYEFARVYQPAPAFVWAEPA